MRRRDFIVVICGAALTLPFGAGAQQPGKVWRIGDVTVSGFERGQSSAQALEQRLADLGYVQGRNIVLLHRLSDPQPDKIAEAIVSLVPQIDLLVVWGTAAIAAKKLAGGVPTVFITVGFPVELGLVESLAHPGGNMTGIASEAALEINGKRLQILKEIVPDLKRVAVLRDATRTRSWGFEWAGLDQAARELRLTLVYIDIKSADELETAFASMNKSGAEALFATRTALMSAAGKQIRRSRARSPSPFVPRLQSHSYGRRIGEPRRRWSGNNSAGRGANRQDHQRHQPSRHPGRAADALRALHQLEDGPFAEPDHPAIAARPRRRGDRVRRRDFMSALLLASATSVRGKSGRSSTGLRLSARRFPRSDQPNRKSLLSGVFRGAASAGQCRGTKPHHRAVFRRGAARGLRRPRSRGRRRGGPEAIVVSNDAIAQAARAARATIPIVLVTGGDPIRAGFAASLARPGGNVTGVTVQAGGEIWGKRMQILKEAVPSAAKVAFVGHPHELGRGCTIPSRAKPAIANLADRSAAREVDPDRGSARCSQNSRRTEPDAIMVDGRAELIAHHQLIVELANKSRLPAMYPWRDYAEAAG